MINLFIRCGLRGCELINANIEDIHTLEGNKVLYIQGKGHEDKDEYVVLTNYLIKLIDKYLIMRRDYIDKSPLLASCGNRSYGHKLDSSTVRRICKEYLKNIGIYSRT
jgi:site-specific recombinase XerD